MNIFLNVCHLGCTTVAGSGKVWPLHLQFNQTSWVTVVALVVSRSIIVM